jgi:lipopolysaccharide/colanic/teichoic acid biosynthesis glycosyltransferase
VIGTLIHRLAKPGAIARDRHSLLLSQTEYHREIARERMRATRRAIPFCLITLELIGRRGLSWRHRSLVQLLHRNLRLTDLKADLGVERIGVLLVDTPEMGGRVVLDRLSTLCQIRQLDVRLSLQVHDPEGFDAEEWIDCPGGDRRRRIGDPSAGEFLRIDRTGVPSSVDVAVPANETSMAVESVAVSGKPITTSRIALPTEPCLSDATDPGLRVKAVPLTSPVVARPSRGIKRAVDLIGASLGLVLVSPLIVLSAIAIKLTTPGPVFFKQTREGMGGRPFTIYKMRTMVADAEQMQAALRVHSHRDGPAFKIKHDPRVTRVGAFLRRTCIDELPQLINVIKGDMSLVGPRPLPWDESRACNHWHRRRLDVPPGLTCHWQVNKATAETFDDWMRMDLRYVDRGTVWQDLKLIARTLLVPFSGRGSD